MKPQEAENWTFLHTKMRDEGFHYCFKHYSSFEEIEDEKFHQLRKIYLEVAEQLESYVEDKFYEANWEVEFNDDEEDNND